MEFINMRILFGFKLVLLGFLWCIAFGSTLAENRTGEKPPSKIDAFGMELQLNGCAAREILWIELYTVALYLRKPTTEPSIATSADYPKSFWVKVTYDRSVPDGIPAGQWKQVMKADLSQTIFDRLNTVIESLDQGDVIQVSAAPGQGDRLWLNGKLVIKESKSDLSEALTRLWLGANPVSKNIRRLLLLGRC